MDPVSLLLGSPRGRYLCANIGYACGDGTPYPSALQQSAAEVLDVLSGVDVDAIARLSEIELLDALSLAVDLARYWQPPDEEDLMFARPDVVAALRPIARAALAAPQARWWAEPVDLDNQCVVAKFDRRPSGTQLPRVPHDVDLGRWREDSLSNERRFREYLAADPTRDISGEWWSTPVFSGAVDTSRPRQRLGALELILEEDDSGAEYARVWPVRVHGAPRIYEITGPADWAHLVETYPLPLPASRRSVWFATTGEHHDWLIPDWAAVAADYDAVHLTIHGYLATAGIAIPIAAHAGATVLAGWNPDATCWLRGEFFTVDDDPTDWQWTADGKWTPVRG
ncbi:hypothetical protein [Rhodococcus kronopolitis]|uniref:Uncharacterized protein n=1 Tax=Rhodococcus kronopolitis TaxID=1460226 RepID=A0ABV9FVZ4_9NOCA